MRIVTTATILAISLLLAACAAPPPAPAPAAALTETPVQRGEYLVLVAGCDDCHTPGFFIGNPDMKRRFGGSDLPWSGPWGTNYARNLTPDMETGLGKWTEAQVFEALRHGRRPDGSILLPPMPWQRMALMKEDDVKAIAAFLKSLPPISHAVPASQPPGTDAPANAYMTPPLPPWDMQHIAPPPGG